jgi:hypothetical protein
MASLADGAWAGRKCLIVGGGASLRAWSATECLSPIEDETWTLLERRIDYWIQHLGEAIVLNRAVETLRNRDDYTLWMGMDSSFWRRQKPRDGYDVTRVWVDTGDKRPDVDVVLPCAAPVGTPNRHSALAWGRTLAEGVGCGGNSGFAALNLADVLGAETIYLLGFDMKGEGGRVTHWHDGYAEKAPSDSICDRWLEAFRWAATKVRAKVVVLEVQPGDSRLDCFEKRKAEEVL